MLLVAMIFTISSLNKILMGFLSLLQAPSPTLQSTCEESSLEVGSEVAVSTRAEIGEIKTRPAS